MLCIQPALYTRSKCPTISCYCTAIYVQHAQVNSLTMINIIALSLYNVKPHACLSTLALPEGKPYLVFPMHLPHVTKYMYDHTCCRSCTLFSHPPSLIGTMAAVTPECPAGRSCSKAGSINHKSCVLAQLTFLEPFLCTHLVSNCMNDVQYIQ